MCQGIALRGLFIIDKEGIIQHATINNLAIGRSVDETMRTLQVFIFKSKDLKHCFSSKIWKYSLVWLFRKLLVGFLTLFNCSWSYRHYSMCKRTQMKFAQLGGSLGRSPWNPTPSSARIILQQYKGDTVSILIIIWRGSTEFCTHVGFIWLWVLRRYFLRINI